MKYSLKLFSLFLFVLISACSSDDMKNKTFLFSPEKPTLDSEIEIKFNPAETKLKDSENIDVTAYYFSNNLDKVELIPVNYNGGILEASLTPPDSALGILIKFSDGEVVENNEGRGFVIQLYDENGNLLPGSNAGLAVANSVWGSRYADIDLNRDKALELFETEFKENPGKKREYLNDYFSVIKRVKADIADSVVSVTLTELEKDGNFSESDFVILSKWYKNIDEEKAESYKDSLRMKNPENEMFQDEKLNEIYSEKDIQKKLKLLDEYKKTFPKNENRVTAFDLTANYYRDAKDFDTALKFLKENQNEVSLYRFYSIGNRALEENADPETVVEIAELGVERGRVDLNDLDKKPYYQTKKEWLNETKLLLSYNYLVSGRAEKLLDKPEAALSNLEEAYELSEGEESEINEFYAELLLQNNSLEKAMEILENSIKEGNSNSKMKDLLKKAYVEKNGSDENFEEYLSEFESAANKKLVGELKKKMINEPAPEFTLTDLNGDEVSLADFKGQKVVLDFWATWCGPCLQSFPGMKTAVEKYGENENIKFLFVNTWESAEDKKANAEEFISKNEYPFHVLLDVENKVITDYKVTGIPTKFIIDKDGNIRFKSIGFEGNADHLVEEIGVMLDMLN